VSAVRALAPSLGGTIAALLAVALFGRLGVWQWQRGVEREAEAARFARGTAQLIDLDARAASDLPLDQRVSVRGWLDGAHQFLLDNRSWQGRPGYEVLTPLARARGTTLLVDRGWVAFTGTRARLPDVRLSQDAPVRLSGRLALLPSPGLRLGRAAPERQAPWPKVTSYPDFAQLAAALGTALEPRLLLLDASEPLGYVRDWLPPGLAPLRHFSYAIQWWSFAVLSVIVWALMSRRRAVTAG
jgi:surfeit locus 1 family protein